MADRQMGYSTTMVLVIVLALAALALGAWQLGFFERSSADDERVTYKAGVTDVSGGELIVTDPDAPQIEDLKLPETPMTPVPPGKDASDAAPARTKAE